MHTVHLPTKGETKNGFIASAMGLFFSVNDYSRNVTPSQVAIIDEFFDSLSWSTTDSNPKVAEVSYGRIMMMADMNNRWTYKGSVTTPPCAQNVYWNVLRTVYPIKQKHFDQFMSQLARSGLEKTGNYRLIQKETKDHNPFIITGGTPQKGQSLKERVFNYLKFAIVENQKDVTPEQCAATCAPFSQYFCCANVAITQAGASEQFSNVCINNAIGNGGSGKLTLANNVNVDITCSGATTMKYVASSMMLAVLAYI